MESGVEYTQEFYLAHGQGPNNLSISLFANEQCGNLLFGGFDCPVGISSWSELAIDTFSLSLNQRNKAKITFTPDKNYNAVVIGPSCSPVKHPNQNSPPLYYYLDHLILNESEHFDKANLKVENNPCTKSVSLSHQKKGHIKAMWYRNGIALTGENRDTLELNYGDFGSYDLILEFDSFCIVSEKFILDESYVKLSPKEDQCPTDLSVYNVFTPGTDGFNDTWKIDFEGFSTISVEIFNRWG